MADISVEMTPQYEGTSLDGGRSDSLDRDPTAVVVVRMRRTAFSVPRVSSALLPLKIDTPF